MNSPQTAVAESVHELFQRGLQLHQNSRLAEAEAIYRQVLEQRPRHSDALHLTGVIAMQTGALERAVEFINKSIEINPTLPAAYSNLGRALGDLKRNDEALANYGRAISLAPDFAEAYVNRGNTLSVMERFEDAIASYTQGIALKPDYAEAYSNRGNALQRVGKIAEAVEDYRTAIQLKPDYAEGHNNLGAAFSALKRYDEAIASYTSAIELKPDYSEAYNNRGLAWHISGQHEKAIEDYDKVIAIVPQFANAHHNRANALSALKRHAEAVESYDLAIAINPYNADSHNNKSISLKDLKRFEEAIVSCDKAIELRPAFAEAYCNRGNAFKALARHDEALDDYEHAITLRDNFADAKYNYGLCLLQLGQFGLGLKYYEYRRKRKVAPPVKIYTQPQWVGNNSIDGKILFIHSELFLGDTIQFCRYAPLAEELGAKVIMAAPPALHRLLKSLSPTIQFIAANEEPQAFDYHCPMMSLPLAFKNTVDTVFAKTPYLAAEQDRVDKWKDRLSGEGFKIGICWQGSTRPYAIPMERSYPLIELQRISQIPGVRLISLQKTEGLDQLEALPAGMKVETLGSDFDDGPDAFIDTTAVLENVDLVITCDTAIAHLAGALGRPTWLAVPRGPEWRWLLDRSDSPWYPTMRLFRHQGEGGWPSVFSQIEGALQAMGPLGTGPLPQIAAAAETPIVPVSWGELIDKITILEIKAQHIKAEPALTNIRKEMDRLLTKAPATLLDDPSVKRLRTKLKSVNKKLWAIEDEIRDKEAAKDFGPEFVELARSVYQQNDERAALKRRLNALLSSELIEEKSYKSY